MKNKFGEFCDSKTPSKRRSLFALIALVAVIGFSFAACGDGGGNNPQTETYKGTSGGTTYTLKITENTARYTAQNGDNYVLTGGSKTSKGMVFSFANGVLFTLIPSNAPTAQFTVAVSGNSITAINNTITWTDNTTATVSGEFTGGNNNNSGDMTWTAVADSKFGTSGINAITYGDGKFVAGGEDGKMAYSSDNCVTWTAVSNSTFGTSGIKAIAYGGGKFVAGGKDGKMAYSTDGATWTAVTQSVFVSSDYIEAIAYENGTFVAGGGYAKIATSTDGETWTERDLSSILTGYIMVIAYGNGTFVASNSTRPEKTVYSTDNGATWTGVDVKNIFNPTDELYGIGIVSAIAYGSNKFVIMGSSANSKAILLTSPDGRAWTPVEGGSHLYNDAIIYDGNKFVAVGTVYATSSDGVTWTRGTQLSIGSNGSNAFAYGNGTFVVGNYNGKMAYSSGGGTSGSGGNNSQTTTYTGTASGTTYTLKTTGNTSAPQSGDAYELTAGTKKSTGTVNNVSGSVLTLKPSNAATTFTATVSGSSLTALNGTITWTDNTTAAAPGAFTGGTDPGTGSGGTFTITDIPSKYNGKYAYFVGGTTTNPDYTLIGYQSLGNDDFILTPISGGSVSIPVWFVNKADNTSGRYSGNDTFNIGFSIHDSSSYVDSDDLVTSTFASVKFSNGSAAKSKNDASLWYEW